MKSSNPTWSELVGFELATLTAPPKRAGSASLLARLSARLFAARYDAQVEAGVTPTVGSPLAIHYTRLTTPRERADLAHSLQMVLRDAVEGPDALRPRVPVRTVAVRQAADAIEPVVRRLVGPAAVRARGVARLRILLADGGGPLYRPGRGSLHAALRGVLATL